MNKGCFLHAIRGLVVKNTSLPPSNTVPPTISGDAIIGSTLFAGPGQWQRASSFVFEWFRDGITTGVMGASYVLGASDVGHQVNLKCTASNSAGSAVVFSSFTAIVVTPSLPALPNNIGLTPGYTAPGTPDYVVASDGSGTHLTLAAALATVGASANKHIHCKSGREYAPFGGFALSAPGLTVSSNRNYTLSGGLKVTGWTQCTSADSALLGSSYASIYKVTIPVDTTGANPNAIHHRAFNALLLTENDVALNIVTRRRDETDLWEQTDDNAFFRHDQGDTLAIGTDANGYATTITHAAVLGAFTDAQLAKAAVMLLAYPNVPAVVGIASASGGVLTLNNPVVTDSTGTHPKYKPDLAPSGGAYALMNILAYLKQGQWGYVDNGDNTITLYLWPNSTADLASGIEVAREKIVLNITGSNVLIDGLLATHTADDGVNTAVIYVNGASGCTIRETKVYNFSHAQKGYSGVLMRAVMGFTMHNYEIADGQNQYGWFVTGLRPLPILTNPNTARAAQSQNIRIFNGHVKHCSQTAARIYSSWNVAVYNFLFENCGLAAHANKGNAYEGSDLVVFSNGEWRNCGGYLTWQEATRVYIINCLVPCDPGTTSPNGRGIYDQNHSSDNGPTSPSNNYIINCAAPRPTGAFRGYSSIVLGDAFWQNFWTILNCVADGITSQSGKIIRQDNNLLTMGTAVGASDVVTTQAALYANDNWQAVAGSAINTKAGTDVTSIIQDLEALMPDVPLRQCLTGTWDPAHPGMGPWGGSLAVGA